LVAEGNRVHAIAQTKLREDVADVRSHRGFAEEENPRPESRRATSFRTSTSPSDEDAVHRGTGKRARTA
jgi:hypothetical protein